MVNTILALFRMMVLALGGYQQVALENMALRQQLGIFRRSVPRPKTRVVFRTAMIRRIHENQDEGVFTCASTLTA